MRTAERLWRQRVCAVFRRSGVSCNDIEDLCQEVAISYFRIRGVAPWDDIPAQPYLVAHLPTGVIVTCPLQGSDFTTPDQWCQRVVNSDCDGWLGCRADYLRQRNKCWWDMETGYYLVTCGQWRPWDCCYEQEATPEPPCPRNRYQIYCVPNTPQQCP
ncbi:MAG: hypothetical protein KatS3mg023_0514 [Armatimonadota bacterium]|nr:MAG: hypothetical protein KatS3mg023_0514 [Armatimonadota bacterium]